MNRENLLCHVRALCAGIGLLAALLLVGCGGGGGGTTANGDVPTAAVRITGTAARGAPVVSATVTIKDATGKIATGTTDANGKFTIDLAKPAAPLLLRIPTSNGYLYSVATTANADTTITINIHPFTDLIIKNWYLANGSSVEAEFSNSGALTNVPKLTEINTIEAVISSILSTNLSNAGVASNFDLISGAFDANSTGFDKVLDNTQVVIDTTTGGVTVTATDAATGITGTVVSTDAPIATANDTAPPTVPDGLAVLPASPTSVVLVWTASSDNVGVAGYNVYRDGSKIATSPYPVYTDTGRTSGTSYCYMVEAFDGKGNVSTSKSSESCATPPATADSIAPSTPTGLSATTVSASQIDLSWSASTDNVGVLGYAIYRGATLVATVNGTSFSDVGLAAGTTYSYTVKAVDSALNTSSASASASDTTSAGIPSVPTGIAGSPANGQAWINWNAVSGATSYNLYWSTTSGVTKSNGTKIAGVSRPYAHSGRTNGTTYYYVVTAVNALGESAESAQISVTPAAGTSSSAAVAGDFAGSWGGILSMYAPAVDANHPAESSTDPVSVVLTANGNQVSGTIFVPGNATQSSSIFSISGTVANGVYSFNLPSTGPSIPDCANWNMPVTVTFDASLTTATLNSSGTVCGPNGGKPGTLTATLTRATGTKTASGTYTWDQVTGAMGFNWTSSTFAPACTGPMSGSSSTETGMTVGATSMTWPSNSLTWSRSSGTDGDIVGTWTNTTPAGNVFTLTYSANGTMTLSADVVACDSGSASSGGTVPVAGSNSASGTYIWDAGTSTLTMTPTVSNFVCSGPRVGGNNAPATGITISSTTMTWNPPDSTTWTRAISGAANDIVGVWTTTTMSGLPFELIFNADGTFSASGTDECAQANAQTFVNGYYIDLQYKDPAHTATAVGVSGPNINDGIVPLIMTYHASSGTWGDSLNPSYNMPMGPTYPGGLPLTYVFTVTSASGTTTQTANVSCFQQQFVSNVAPSGAVSGAITFTWTGISDPGATYGVWVQDPNGTGALWNSYGLTGTTNNYGGPALVPGTTYNYSVQAVGSSSTCSNGTSSVVGSFTYQ